MKRISHLSIIIMSTILAISINSICMEKEISRISNPLYYQKLINIIEEQLVIKEIERYGISYVQDNLNRQELWQSLEKHTKKPLLIIKKTFFKPKRKKDLLTQSIFKAIELQSLDHESELPKQFLSNQIRYYVIKNKPAVLVVAKLTNKDRIHKIIDSYKKATLANKEHVEKIINTNNNINPCKTICLTISATCLLCYLLAIAQVMG